jgi:hypothetical protein
MADQNSLRLIGLGFGAIAAAVMMIAAFLVAETNRAGRQAPPLIASASAASG